MSDLRLPRVLIVDDSPVQREALAYLFAQSGRLEVLPPLQSGAEAIEYLESARRNNLPSPDVIVMDIVMPGIDGFETTRRIMASTPLPIVITSSGLDTNTAEKTFQALEAGAVTVMSKPPGVLHPDYARIRDEASRFVESMAKVPVVRRWASRRSSAQPAAVAAGTPPAPGARAGSRARYEIVAIGASTGGPAALQILLENLHAPFPLPILVVQHIARGFIGAMAEWMSKVTRHRVVVAEDGQIIEPGTVYLAPDDRHMILGERGELRLVGDLAGENLCPSANRLFGSVASRSGSSAIGILLTGMGQDGALELKHLRNSGALTIAQDRESSVVFGMPGAAIRMGAAEFVLPPLEIAKLLEGMEYATG